MARDWMVSSLRPASIPLDQPALTDSLASTGALAKVESFRVSEFSQKGIDRSKERDGSSQCGENWDNSSASWVKPMASMPSPIE